VGIFGNKGLNDEAVIMATLVTFGQSIHAVSVASHQDLDEAWDLFINSLGLMADGGLISESSGFAISELVKFPDDHDLVLDLLKIRSRLPEVQSFIQSNKRSLELVFSPNAIDAKIDWSPQDFAETLTAMSKRTFPKFGSTQSDQEFIAVMGIYMMALISDTQGDTRSNKTFRRLTGYEFALRWLAEWNIRQRLAN
jgi:hypothetical protein